MAGLYIHIPFCSQACHYCDFHFSTVQKNRTAVIEAIAKEIALRANGNQSSIQTIYFGGGTPSLLSAKELEVFFEAIHQNFRFDSTSIKSETTLEVNPENVTIANIELWQQLGINRVSMGIQSFFDEHLQWMNRSHAANQANEAMQLLTASELDISADLIFGFSNLTDQQWQQNLEQLVAFNPEHISCYSITVEPNTVLHKRIEKGVESTMMDEGVRQQMELAMNYLASNGYEHYEISSYAKKGKRAVHNSAYWNNQDYWGVGPSAHGFQQGVRYHNIANNSKYVQSIMDNQLPSEIEQLTQRDTFNEFVLCKLRLIDGFTWDESTAVLNAEATALLKQKAQKFVKRGWLADTGNGVSLTREGVFHSDGMAAGMFL